MVFETSFFVLCFPGIDHSTLASHITGLLVRVLPVFCNGNAGGLSRFCSIDNSLSEICCDDDLSSGVCCVDNDVFGSDTGDTACSLSSLSTFFFYCGCNVSGLLLTV